MSSLAATSTAVSLTQLRTYGYVLWYHVPPIPSWSSYICHQQILEGTHSVVVYTALLEIESERNTPNTDHVSQANNKVYNLDLPSTDNDYGNVLHGG